MLLKVKREVVIKDVFMPPTWKKLRGHIGLGLSVHSFLILDKVNR